MTCDLVSVQNGSECLESCPSGKTTLTGFNNCTDCSPQCLTCADNTRRCLSCPAGKVLLDNGCLRTTCPETHTEIAKKCLKCHASCKLCSGILNSECTQCYSEKVLFKGKCELSTGECPIGTYEANQVCEICDSACTKCFGSS